MFWCCEPLMRFRSSLHLHNKIGLKLVSFHAIISHFFPTYPRCLSSGGRHDRAALPAGCPGHPRGPRLPGTDASAASTAGGSSCAATPRHALDQRRRAANLHIPGQLFGDIVRGIDLDRLRSCVKLLEVVEGAPAMEKLPYRKLPMIT